MNRLQMIPWWVWVTVGAALCQAAWNAVEGDWWQARLAVAAVILLIWVYWEGAE